MSRENKHRSENEVVNEILREIQSVQTGESSDRRTENDGEVPGSSEDSGLLGFQGNPPEPKPLGKGLLPVDPMRPEMIPIALREWVIDIADRKQCPLEYTATGALVALAAHVGRRIAIRPKQYDDWTVFANLWGMVIGRPGVIKSNALTDVMRPLGRLDEEARYTYCSEIRDYEHRTASLKSKLAEINRALRDLDPESEEAGRGDSLREMAAEAERNHGSAPLQRRYIVQDTTVEKLGEILAANPNGLLLYRDELKGFLRGLEKQNRETDRTFYLECWNGDGSFTFDRIGRGTMHVPSLCLSILGTIQPGPVVEYVRAAANGGGGDDGLIQRFQLMVYPDQREEWVNVDRPPNRDAMARATRLFEAVGELDPRKIGAGSDDYGGQPFLRFSEGGQIIFNRWLGSLEQKLRTPDEDSTIISHLSKYRSLMPKLALLLHLAGGTDGLRGGPVSVEAALNAEAWCNLLESHARRVFGGDDDQVSRSARALLRQIRAGKVPNPFRVHQVVNNGWAGLGTTRNVEDAVARLESLDCLLREAIPSGPRGGRPSEIVHINRRLSGD